MQQPQKNQDQSSTLQVQGNGIDADHDDDHNQTLTHDIRGSEVDPCNPPDSFWVTETDEYDWLDRHTFIERKASIKFAGTRGHKQRSFSMNHKPKTSIIGPPKAMHNDGKFKPPPPQTPKRLFRNRSEPGKDYAMHVSEPGSPKVSCIGRVGPKRCRRARAGFWASVKAAFVINRSRSGQ